MNGSYRWLRSYWRRGGVMVLVACIAVGVISLNDGLRAAQAAPAQNGQAAPQAPGEFMQGPDGWWLIARTGGGVNDEGGGVGRVKVQDFWPDQTSRNARNILVAGDGTPLSALASGYLTPLFASADAAFPGGVVEIMKPFRPYQIIRREGTSLLVAEPPFSPQSPTFWVRVGDAYVWSTGVWADVRATVTIHATEALARRSGGQAMTPTSRYVTITFPSFFAAGPPPLSKLPVLRRVGDVVALLCPAYGGQLCWVDLARAGDGVTLSNTP